MGTSTIYTANGSTTDTDAGGAIFVQVPVTVDNGNFNEGSPATVTSFDAHLSSQSGNDVLSIQNHTSTWSGITESVTVSGNQVSVNGTVYGTYSFSNQDLVFTFNSGNSSDDTIGAIMDAVAYQTTAPAPAAAETETVSWSFTANATTTASTDTINVAAQSGITFTATGATTVTADGNSSVFVQGPLRDSTDGTETVTSFDAHLSSQSGSDVLSIQNNTSTWDGNTESVTVSGNQVFVNNTLYGTYSFANQDLVFTFSSGNSNPDIIGAIMDAVAYQNTAFPRGASGSFVAENETVSWTFNSTAGTTLAPSDSITVASFYPGAVNIVELNGTSSGAATTSVTTYVGTPVVLSPATEFQSLQAIGPTGAPHEPSVTGMAVSIVSGGGQLGFNPFTTFDGGSVTVVHDATDPTLWREYFGDLEVDVSIQSSSLIDVYTPLQINVAGSGNDPGYLAAIADNITYENTSSNAPSSAQIVFEPSNVVDGDGYTTGNLTVTVNLTPLPTVVTETATVTSDGAVSGTARITGTGALAGDSDANADYTLSVSAVSGGTLGSASHGTYGDLTLNADGSFSYAAGATSTEIANIAAASGQVTDAFTFSVSDGHGGVTSATLDIDLDATKPSISSIAFSPPSGDLAVNANVTITLNLSNVGAIDIAGNGPTLTLNDGGTATYDAAASTGTSLVFDYTVASSDTDVASLAVNSVNLGATTLTNPSGVATVTSTSLPVTGVTQSGPQIDTTTPAVTAIAENPSSGEIAYGATVTFTLTTNDPVTVDTTNGAPTLTLNDNGIATYDAAASTGTSLVFDYKLTGTDIANVASLQAQDLNLDGAVIANGAGTAANLSLAGLSQSGPQIDLPQLTGGAALPSSGTYGAGETMGLLLEISKAVTVTGSDITLSLNDGGTATLDVANTAAFEQFGLVAFDYQVAPTDHDVASLAVTGINLNGGTILDSLGDETQFSTLPTFNDVAIDTGKPSIASIGFSPSSGDLAIGASETITLSLSDVGAIDIAGGGPTLTLNDGGTATYDAAASTGTSLVFDYKVASSDTDVASLAVNSVNLDGTTLTNRSDTATVTSLSVTGLTQSGPQIDVGATLTTLYSFTTGNTVGTSPDAGLIEDAAGDLFGTTANGTGTVFELVNNGNGSYTPGALYSFDNPGGTLGTSAVSGLVVDAAGDLFGTSEEGGAGGGMVFELVNTGIGSTGYTPETPVFFPNFFPETNGNGLNPVGGLIADAAGDLFGTTEFGGTNGEGTVFEVVNHGSYFTATTLFSFDGGDGADPQAGLIADAAGDFFGTTAIGGTNGDGTVFELVNNGSGSYTPITLVNFDGTDGANPQAGLIADAAGDLFGTTASGGTNGDGAVFELVNNGNGSYTPTTLLSFDGTNGRDPQAGLIADAAGDLFGTTKLGGTSNDGTVFELVNNGNGSYTPITLVNFDGTDGANPLAGLIADAAGDLFGTTQIGGTGAGNAGTVFEITDSGYQTQAPCYCPGTLIGTRSGTKRVEKLRIGDEVMTASGATRPIKWIGRRSYTGRFVMGRKDILPVCIKAGAIDDNVPARDLWISPHHAMYLDGVLIEAKDLINGVSIVQAADVERVEYFHVELDSHDVIIAEGALSESFVDDDSRGMFQNAHEYNTLYAGEGRQPARYCAPRLDHGYEVEAVRRRLALRAGLPAKEIAIGSLRGCVDRITPHVVEGWAQNVEHPEAPVCLDFFIGGKLIGRVLANRYRNDLAEARLGSGNHSFEFILPDGLELVSSVVEVRRSLDGTALPPSESALADFAVWRRGRVAA